MADTEARWYCVSAQGLPMLCASKEDAEREAARNDKVWPKGAPHRAVQLCDAAERDRLRAELAAAQERSHSCHDNCSRSGCVSQRLRADVAATRKDAERYQLLRRGQHWSVIDGIGDTLRAEQLDAAIDATTALHNAEFCGGQRSDSINLDASRPSEATPGYACGQGENQCAIARSK